MPNEFQDKDAFLAQLSRLYESAASLTIRPIKPERNSYRSSHWKKLRVHALERDEFRCTQCRTTENLQIHHLTYENEYDENLEDVITMCISCHAKVKKVTAKAAADGSE